MKEIIFECPVENHVPRNRLRINARRYKKKIAELEAKNAELEKRIAELEDQEDGYKRLVDALSECVVECKAGDGFYGNDPVEMIGDIGNRFDTLAAELECRSRGGEIF